MPYAYVFPKTIAPEETDDNNIMVYLLTKF